MTMVSNPNVDLNLNENKNYFCFRFNFVDFCHDSAKQASLMALAAPKVQDSGFRFQEHLKARKERI